MSMLMPSRISIWLGLVLSFVLAARTDAQIARAPAMRDLRIGPPSANGVESAKDWSRQLLAIDRDLRSGEWDRARRLSDRVVRDMLARIDVGVETGPTLALALTFRALAASGLGDLAAARWDWTAAQAIQPDLSEASFDPYGRAKQPLEPYRLTRDGTLPSIALPAAKGPSFDVAPTKTGGAEPPYPKALRATCGKGVVRLAVTVDAMGRPITPRLGDPAPDPLMAVAAFETVRGWSYRPALAAGRPVAADLALDFDFDPGRCRPKKAAEGGSR